MLVDPKNNPNKGAVQDGDPRFSKPASLEDLPVEVQEALAGQVVSQPTPASVAPVASVAKVEASVVATPDPRTRPAVPDQTMLLITLLEKLSKSIEKQTEIAERGGRADAEAEMRINTKRAAYAQNRGDEVDAVKQKQAACLHLKGGDLRWKMMRDPAVYFHRFVDNTVYIKCILCKMKWYPVDTADTIFRGGQARPNHTHIGWIEAARLVSESTNKPSRSEIPAEMRANIQKKENVPDDLGVITGPSRNSLSQTREV
jgi:hypothetical protein